MEIVRILNILTSGNEPLALASSDVIPDLQRTLNPRRQLSHSGGGNLLKGYGQAIP
jgi:hypothetical protein